MKYHLLRSKKVPGKAIQIGEFENGLYCIPAADGHVPPEQNLFSSIEEIEQVLNDEFDLMRPKDERDD